MRKIVLPAKPWIYALAQHEVTKEPSRFAHEHGASANGITVPHWCSDSRSPDCPYKSNCCASAVWRAQGGHYGHDTPERIEQDKQKYAGCLECMQPCRSVATITE